VKRRYREREMAIVSNEDEIKQLMEAGYRAEYGLRPLNNNEHVNGPNKDLARTFYRRAMDKGSRIACIHHMHVMTDAQIGANEPSHNAVALYWNPASIKDALEAAARDSDIASNKHFWWALVLLARMAKRTPGKYHAFGFGNTTHTRVWTQSAAELLHAEAICLRSMRHSRVAFIRDKHYDELCFAACTELHIGCAKQLMLFISTNNGSNMIVDEDIPLALACAAFVKRTMVAQSLYTDESFLRIGALQTGLSAQETEEFVTKYTQQLLSIELAPRKLINRSEMIHIAQQLSERLSESELNEGPRYNVNVARNCKEMLTSNAEYVCV
jgi:hypothetical protein